MQQNIMMKQGLREKKEREIQEKKQINQERKYMMRTKIQERREEKLKQLNEEFKLLKIQKQYNDDLRNYINNEEKNINKTKCENIRSQHLIKEEKKRTFDVFILNI
jgi:hypothetical protein